MSDSHAAVVEKNDLKGPSSPTSALGTARIFGVGGSHFYHFKHDQPSDSHSNRIKRPRPMAFPNRKAAGSMTGKIEAGASELALSSSRKLSASDTTGWNWMSPPDFLENSVLLEI